MPIPKIISQMEARIKRGIVFLDKKIGRKEWLKNINVEELDLGDPSTCMIGEVLGEYGELEEQYKIGDGKAASLGFFDNNSDHYPMLTSLWKATLYKLGAK